MRKEIEQAVYDSLGGDHIIEREEGGGEIQFSVGDGGQIEVNICECDDECPGDCNIRFFRVLVEECVDDGEAE
jgi:hypothetical protein